MWHPEGRFAACATQPGFVLVRVSPCQLFAHVFPALLARRFAPPTALDAVVAAALSRLQRVEHAAAHSHA